MNARITILASLMFGSLLACKPESKQSGGGNGTVSAPASVEDQQVAARAKTPKLILARIKTSELNQKTGNIEMVAIDQNVTVTSGEQAAQLFATGKKLELRQTAQGTEAVNTGSMMLDAGYGYPAGGGYGYPAGGYYGYESYANSFMYWVNVIGSVATGVSYTMSGLMYIAAPFMTYGGYGVGYTGGGAYPSGGYQYYPYAQNQNYQQYPQTQQYPYQQYPQTQYPQTQYPQTQYPQTQYPQTQYPQTQYPQTQYPQTQYPQTTYPQMPTQPTYPEPMPQG